MERPNDPNSATGEAECKGRSLRGSAINPARKSVPLKGRVGYCKNWFSFHSLPLLLRRFHFRRRETAFRRLEKSYHEFAIVNLRADFKVRLGAWKRRIFVR